MAQGRVITLQASIIDMIPFMLIHAERRRRRRQRSQRPQRPPLPPPPPGKSILA